MAVRANVGRTLNPEKLRYVTEHFHELQGLASVLLGAFFLVSPMEDLFWINWPLRGWLFLLVFGAEITGVHYVRQYYRHRFGSVESRSPTAKQFAIFVSGLVVLLLFGRPLGRYADSIISRGQSTLPNAFFPLTFPTLFWFAVLCGNIRHHPQREDVHKMYFLSLGAFAWTLVAIYSLLRPDIMPLMFWKILNACWLGISLIAMGLYDHMTLVRLLPKRIPEEEGGGGDND